MRTSNGSTDRRVFRRWTLAGGVLVVLFLAVSVLGGGCAAVRSITGSELVTPVSSSSSGTTPTGVTQSVVKPSNGLLLGVMVHVEGWRNEVDNRQAFEQHSAIVRQCAAAFEKYGLPLTLEASPEFAQACAKWQQNVLKELSDKGHAIGLHADLGAEPGLTQQAFASRLVQMKRDIESLGPKVRHVSGICSSLDWVKAARDAGFEFVTGTVEYALKSIPAGKLPAEYQDVVSATNPAACHGNVPHELADRLHPWRMASGADWLWNNPSGKVVILPGDGGTCITWMAEGSNGGGRVRRAAFDAADVTAFNQEVDKALGLCETDKINALYVGWSIGQQPDPSVVEAWAANVKSYVDSGKVQWKTLPQMYDAYLAWEAAGRQ
jgi:hypothetical protein